MDQAPFTTFQLLDKTLRVHEANIWAIRALLKVILVQVLGKYMGYSQDDGPFLIIGYIAAHNIKEYRNGTLIVGTTQMIIENLDP